MHRNSSRSFLFATTATALVAAACSAAPGESATESTSSAITFNTAAVNAMADFTGDNVADYAEHWQASPAQFWVHANLITAAKPVRSFTGTGTNWGSGQTMASPNWEWFIGDFDGVKDAAGKTHAEFAEHYLGSTTPSLTQGAFFVHTFTGINPTTGQAQYQPTGTNWGTGQTMQGVGWQTLVADFDCDGKVDYADRNISTGEFFIHKNLGVNALTGQGQFQPTGQQWAIGMSAAGGNWQTLVGDFDGDKCADYADFYVGASNQWTQYGNIFIHLNLGRTATDQPTVAPTTGSNFASATWGGNAATIGLSSTMELLVGEFTGDTYGDLLLHDMSTGEFLLQYGQGSGQFSGVTAWGTSVTGPGWSILGGEINPTMPVATRCGDGVCNGTETCATCAPDCSETFTICAQCAENLDTGIEYSRSVTSATGCTAGGAAQTYDQTQVCPAGWYADSYGGACTP